MGHELRIPKYVIRKFQFRFVVWETGACTYIDCVCALVISSSSYLKERKVVKCPYVVSVCMGKYMPRFPGQQNRIEIYKL